MFGRTEVSLQASIFSCFWSNGIFLILHHHLAGAHHHSTITMNCAARSSFSFTPKMSDAPNSFLSRSGDSKWDSAFKIFDIITHRSTAHRFEVLFPILLWLLFSCPFLSCCFADDSTTSLYGSPILTSLNRFTFSFNFMYFSDSLSAITLQKLQFTHSPFQPHDSGYVLLGDLTLDSSTDPEDVYHMVSWTQILKFISLFQTPKICG